jgi:hypothetical protein
MLQRQDAKSLALFEAIQAKLTQAPDWRVYLQDARDWADMVFNERPNDIYLAEWVKLLDAALASEQGLSKLYAMMLSHEQHAIDMRSSSPFAGVLTPKERTEVLLTFQRKWVA